MDYDKKFDEYTYGYTLIVVQAVGDTLNVFTNDHKTAKEALDAYEGWVAHFQELANKYPETRSVYKIQIKRMLNFRTSETCILSDMTAEELKTKIS